jgi:PAS domain S-box-containing protein
MTHHDTDTGLKSIPSQWDSLERLEKATRMAGLGHYVWDVVEDRCLMCSQEHAKIHGMSVEEYLAQASTANGLTHPEDVEVVRAAFASLRRGERFEVEFRIITPAGEERFIREIGHPVFDEAGTVVQEIGTSQDITRQKTLERALRDAENGLFSAIEALPMGFAAYDSDMRLQFFNSTYRALLPTSGHLLKKGLHFEDLLRNSAEAVARSTEYASVEDYVTDRLDVSRRAGKWVYRQSTGRWVRVMTRPNANGGFISMIEDITEQKEKEEQLLQAQKMEAIGQLTGGVAHDFNNLLAVIQGNAELLREIDPDLAPMVQDIIDATRRGADLTQRLLAFSRRQVLIPKSVDLVQLVSGFIRILDRTLGKDIAIQFIARTRSAPAFADRAQIESALLNLALNARDAMPGGGILTVLCDEVDQLPANAEAPGLQGPFVRLSVSDTGTGMHPDEVKRAFDPFYTTKAVGEGSGLGLSMVYGFARQSGGTTTLESTPGVGTTVEIFLPRARADAKDPPQQPTPQMHRGDAETILVVEDDPDLRGLVSRILLHLNYRPICVRDARAARQILEQRDDITLVLADVVLPGGISGPALARALQQEGNSTRFLFMSGYAGGDESAACAEAATPAILQKPFSQADLAAAIQKALARSPAD